MRFDLHKIRLQYDIQIQRGLWLLRKINCLLFVFIINLIDKYYVNLRN